MGKTSFWKQVGERAAKTAAQAFAVAAALGQPGASLFMLDWKAAAGIAGAAALASILTSIATAGVGQPDSPSAVSINTAE
ncbi:holin [Catenuloplanes sp. NPDC051500]|uniref:holin n=1 Tax=Catenuloplanes sp. NPDC051500 TaxID=3363959 RepID=UPI00378B5702